MTSKEKTGTPDLLILVPVFNEGPHVKEVLTDIRRYTAADILAVNDGSTDDSLARIRESDVTHVINHEKNVGPGGALISGFQFATERHYQILITMDADGQHEARDIPRFLEAIEGVDMVVGSRVGAEVHKSVFRRPAKFILTKLAEFLSNRRIPDLNSGFRVFTKEIAQNWLHVLPDGFSFTSTLTIIALHEGYRTMYLPVKYFKREGKSKIRPLRDSLNFLQLILRAILYVNPLRIFIPASLFFFALSLSLFTIRVVFDRAFLVTIIISFICGFELLVVGMLADLIDKRLH